MSRQALVFAVVLLAAGVMVSIGAAAVYRPSGLIVAGLLLALWSWLVLGDAG